MERFDHFFISPSNYDRTLRFFSDVLGWQTVAHWGGDGEARGAVLRGEEIGCVIAEPHEVTDDKSWSDGRNGHRPTVHVACNDLEERHRRIAAAGGTIVVPPEETHWGVRWFVVKDPDDNLIAYFQE